jgi:hypothetical protein
VLADVAEVVSHLLHLAAVVVDAQITLHEESKLGVEVKGVSLTVAEELLLEGNPELLSSVVAVASGLLEVNGDGVEQPQQDHAVHPTPMGVVEGRSVRGDMVVEGVVLERQQHKVVPMWVLGGRDTEDDEHQGLDVLDAASLSVEVADGGSLERASCGGRLPWCRCWRWCCSGSRMRWRWCNHSEDVSELELEGGRGSSLLLGHELDGGDACLKGCEGSGEVGQSGGSLLRHGLDGDSVLMGGDGRSRSLDDGDGRGQVGRSDAGGGRSGGDGVEVEVRGSCHDEVKLGWIWAWAGVGRAWI